MKSYIILLIFSFQLTWGQVINKEKELLTDYPQYDIVMTYDNDFNNDGIKDLLYILSSKKENNEELINSNDSISKRKAVIFLGNNNTYFIKVFDDDNIFPCRECLGKSDNYIDELSFKNNILSYTTSVAPIASNVYSVIKFKLKFCDNNFTIFNYAEEYFVVGKDDSININLEGNNFDAKFFNYYDWYFDKSWFSNIKLSNENVSKINDYAFKLEKVNPSYSIEILKEIIERFPERTVAYLNLADSFWNTEEKEKAIDNYKKYISLMKSQKKDVKKIPKRVIVRTK